MPQISHLNPQKPFTLRVFESRIQYFEWRSRNWIQMIEADPERRSACRTSGERRLAKRWSREQPLRGRDSKGIRESEGARSSRSRRP